MEFSYVNFKGSEAGEDSINENPEYAKTSFADAERFTKKPSPASNLDFTEQDIKQRLKAKQGGQLSMDNGKSWKLNAIIFIIFAMSFSSLVLTVMQRLGNGSLLCACKTTEQEG